MRPMVSDPLCMPAYADICSESSSVFRRISRARRTNSAPASRAASAAGPLAKTRTVTFLPVPLGRTTVPRTAWSLLVGSTPRRKATSAVASNLVVGLSLRNWIAPSRVYRVSRSTFSATFVYFLP